MHASVWGSYFWLTGWLTLALIIAQCTGGGGKTMILQMMGVILMIMMLTRGIGRTFWSRRFRMTTGRGWHNVGGARGWCMRIRATGLWTLALDGGHFIVKSVGGNGLHFKRFGGRGLKSNSGGMCRGLRFKRLSGRSSRGAEGHGAGCGSGLWRTICEGRLEAGGHLT